MTIQADTGDFNADTTNGMLAYPGKVLYNLNKMERLLVGSKV